LEGGLKALKSGEGAEEGVFKEAQDLRRRAKSARIARGREWREAIYMIVSTSVRLDQQLLVSTDESAEETLDDANPLDALAHILDEASVATRKREQFE